MISTAMNVGVAAAVPAHAQGTFVVPAAHIQAAAAAWAGQAHAAPRKRRPAAATFASVYRGSS
ncbi:hypothetical protein [Mycolicibacterium confluentis]|uniref:Uncharacterized protein n=1 Tax=Mycolicibacterium confluentis TaxID=28047 RepID=A0A7I7Y0Y7_9MYCO|nr:hypothetical protein [Mycolicibacterium confluentis]MCV7319751.1 hypothetical protein [Mycolicibacterium confluentis]ORV34337.1 hypothetical protein AWB99_01545 [Mycolicibacterium confluentis]BBZ34781.1 hypothetical protein MCNF_33860 [Mycolicibacterium confluentis]